MCWETCMLPTVRTCDFATVFRTPSRRTFLSQHSNTRRYTPVFRLRTLQIEDHELEIGIPTKRLALSRLVEYRSPIRNRFQSSVRSSPIRALMPFPYASRSRRLNGDKTVGPEVEVTKTGETPSPVWEEMFVIAQITRSFSESPARVL